MTVNERTYAARNPNTPLDVLDELADDESDVGYWVARSPATPGHVLDRLADDADLGVRAAVAGNPNTPGHVLERLADDLDPGVRAAADANANTPGHVRERVPQVSGPSPRQAGPAVSAGTSDEMFGVHCPGCGERIATRILRPFNDREREALQRMHRRRCPVV